MQGYSSTDLANRTGDVLSDAERGAVEITRHGKPRFVVLSKVQYDELVRRGNPQRQFSVDDTDDPDRALLYRSLINDPDG